MTEEYNVMAIPPPTGIILEWIIAIIATAAVGINFY
jgi:hypothetical protein